MRLVKYTADVLIICFAAILAVLAVPPLAGIRTYTVISSSMSPEILPGAAVYVCSRPFADIREGDVITYQLGDAGMTVTHRVLEKREKEKTFCTKGDANAQADAKKVKYEDVFGVVRLSVPVLGYAALFLKGPEKKIMVAAVLLWLLIMERAADDMIKMKKEEDIYG